METLKYTYILLFIAIFLIQCVNKEEERYMPPVFSLQEERKTTVLNSDFILGTGGVHVLDSFLIVNAETDINNKHLHVFNKFTGRYILSMGNPGQGPGELTVPVNRVAIDNQNRKVYVYDLGKRKLISFDLGHLSGNTDIKGMEEDLPGHMQSHLELAYLGNEEFLVAYPTVTNSRFVKGTKRIPSQLILLIPDCRNLMNTSMWKKVIFSIHHT